jgi:hypothetical protein
MRKKYRLFISLLFSLLFFSCKKEAVKKDDVSSQTFTKTELLTRVTWKYYEYLVNYNQSNTILAYRILRPNNFYDLSKSRLKYNVDGTYEETLNTGANLKGTWKFTEDEKGITLNINQKKYTIEIYTLEATFFEWADKDGDSIGRMVPL